MWLDSLMIKAFSQGLRCLLVLLVPRGGHPANPQVPTVPSEVHMEGTIQKLMRERGFGFIRANGHRIFFHRSGLREFDFQTLKEGQAVEFELERGPKGLQARNVRIS
jgi:cold shock protein